ncbi:guanitoxin biosynthesis MATE family efflux transporter GntT [Dendronalium sp. ChiSLP03b]|uniref:guanitoxin biosynthesis MATE family efflux transporter GntT n=1 Tax=Dendronalium sp. ChiSLP03b TaxID=3075381 RepID=UPI002AD25A2C|nr:guanitoxin biosynthesis MATE family efflux transporter GntT [Dendronalium sp. ChiSLP03b]MDZ8203100.1 guanitoxin biosynthesis MATE family efflux transporter GntT [Dendronalium sp. ChiSLP03b]
MAFVVPTQYNFLPRFYRLASVSVLSNMMVPLAGLVDIAFLGHLADIRHLAGVILATILFDYLYRVLKFLRSSTNALTAQAVGLDDSKAILLAGLRSGLIALGIGLLIILLQYPLQKIGFTILSGSPDIEASGIDYFCGRIWGAPAVLLNFVLIGWFLGREMNSVVLLISLIGNGSNVLLDYLMIVRWGWESMGAGLATAISQYLALAIGLIGVCFSISWTALPAALPEVFDWAALKDAVALKSNILVRFLALISAYAIFTNLSAGMGTIVLAENGLLLQIALLSQFTIQGVGMTTQTLTGNFLGKGTTEQMVPLLSISVLTSLLMALAFATISIVFPDAVFGLLTNHTEVNKHIGNYIIWLLPLLGFTAVAFMLEGYFIGLKEGVILRNAVLIAFGLGFIPLAIAAWYFHNNHLLWMALVSYMMTIIVVLGLKLPRTFGSQNLQNQELLPSS